MSVSAPTSLNTPPATFRFKLTVYGDSNGKMLQHREIMVGTAPPDFHQFMGMSQHAVTVGGRKGMLPLEFAVMGARTVEEAWDFYNGCEQAALEAALHNLQAQQKDAPVILTPDMIRQAQAAMPDLRRRG